MYGCMDRLKDWCMYVCMTTVQPYIISYSRRCGISVVDAAMRLMMTSKDGFSRLLDDDDGASSMMSLIIPSFDKGD